MARHLRPQLREEARVVAALIAIPRDAANVGVLGKFFRQRLLSHAVFAWVRSGGLLLRTQPLGKVPTQPSFREPLFGRLFRGARPRALSFLCREFSLFRALASHLSRNTVQHSS